MLDEIEVAPTINAIRNQLENCPRDLESLYLKITDRLRNDLSDYDLAISTNILKWLCVALHPFSVNQISTALAVQASQTTFDPGCLLTTPRDDIIRSCSSLVEILDDGRIQLVHLTVKEFLLKKALPASTSIDTTYGFHEESVHAKVACVLLSYLSYPEFLPQTFFEKRETGVSSERFFQDRARSASGIFCLFNYACSAVLYHCLQSGTECEDAKNANKQAINFLEEKNSLLYLLKLQLCNDSDHCLSFESRWSSWSGKFISEESDERISQAWFRDGLERLLAFEDGCFGESDSDTLDLLRFLSSIYSTTGNVERAIKLRLAISQLTQAAVTDWRASDEVTHAQLTHFRALTDYAGLLSAERFITNADAIFEEVNEFVTERIWTEFGKDHDFSVSVLHHLGLHYRRLGHYEGAIQIHEWLADYYQSTHGDHYHMTLMCLSSLATDYRCCNRLIESQEMERAVFGHLVRTLGLTDSKTISSYLSLAQLDKILGRQEDAARKYKEILNFYESLYGVNHPKYTRTLCSLAAVQFAHNLCPLQDIQVYLEHGVENSTRYSGTEANEATLHLLNSLSWVYSKMDELEKALHVSKKADTVTEAIFGSEHVETLKASTQVARMLARILGREKEAEERFLHLITTAEAVFGEGASQTLEIMQAYGTSILRHQKRFREGAELLHRILDRCDNSSTADLFLHRWRTYTLGYLATFYLALEDYTNAEKYYLEHLAGLRTDLAEDHVDILEAKENVGTCCWYLDKGDMAQSYFKDVFEERQKCLGPQHQDTRKAMKLLGGAYKKQGRWQDRIDLTEKRLAICRELGFEDGHPEMVSGMEVLEESYRMLGKGDEADQLAKKLADVRISE